MNEPIRKQFHFLKEDELWEITYEFYKGWQWLNSSSLKVPGSERKCSCSDKSYWESKLKGDRNA